MPVSLAQAKLNVTDDVDVMVIDEFRKSSALLDALIFDDVVSPAGGGSALTYGYTRQITQRSAAFRAINSEYTPQEATKQRFNVDLKPLGGSFQIDRVLNDIGQARETAFQMAQTIKATRTKFQDEVINGDTAVDENGFDGLDKALAGSATELNADGSMAVDWTNLGAADAAQGALDDLDVLLGLLDGPPSLLISNDLVAAKVRAIARRANMYVEAPVDGLLDEFGAPVSRQRVGNAVLIDAGEKPGSNQRIVPVYDPDSATWSVTLTGGPTGGTFSLVVSVDGGPEEESGAIAYNATTGAVDTAIEALDNVPTGSVTVGGSAGAWTLTFGGDLANVDVTVALEDNGLTGGTNPSATVTETGDSGGYSDLYTVRIAEDGFMGVSTVGPLVRQWMPDFSTAGAVKTGEVEMGPVAVVLKATKAAAVLRKIKVR